MPRIWIDDLTAALEQYPQLAVYRNLKDTEVADKGMLLAEGHHLVQRLGLAMSDGGNREGVRPYVLDSVLTMPSKADELEAIAASIDPAVPVFVAPARVINEIVGFKFHIGVLAAARRLPAWQLSQMMARVNLHQPRICLVAMQELNNAANIGAILRTSAALGVAGVLIGERCIDPWIRMALRTSMGAMFTLPTCQPARLVDDLRLLAAPIAEGGYGFTTIATTLSPLAIPLTRFDWPARSVLVLGSEGQGLDAETVSACSCELTIPMHHGTDSLNVAAATAIMLWEMTRRVNG